MHTSSTCPCTHAETHTKHDFAWQSAPAIMHKFHGSYSSMLRYVPKISNIFFSSFSQTITQILTFISKASSSAVISILIFYKHKSGV